MRLCKYLRPYRDTFFAFRPEHPQVKHLQPKPREYGHDKNQREVKPDPKDELDVIPSAELVRVSFVRQIRGGPHQRAQSPDARSEANPQVKRNGAFRRPGRPVKHDLFNYHA